jgi:hypothetical protein
MWGAGDDDGTTKVRARLASSAMFSAAEIAALAPDLDGYDGVRLSFFVSFLVDAEGRAIAAEGSLEVFGGTSPACDMPGAPCPGFRRRRWSGVSKCGERRQSLPPLARCEDARAALSSPGFAHRRDDHCCGVGMLTVTAFRLRWRR